MWLPKPMQQVVFWTIDVIGVSVILFVPLYLLRYGADSILTQDFGEGVVVEVIGAVGTAVLLVNISVFARNAGVVASADQEQIDQLQQELHEVKQELAEIKSLLQPRKRPFLIRLLFGK